MSSKLALTLALVVVTTSLVAQQSISAHYKIYDVKNGKLATLEDIVGAAAAADVIFFGEEHNDSAGHYLEAAIFKGLHQRFGKDLALSLEMFETDCQLVLDEYLLGYISEERFTRESRAWSNYRDYRPMIEYAKDNRLQVIAANPPRRYVNMVSRKGMKSLDSLPKASKKFLPHLPYDTLSGPYRDKFMDFMKGGSPGTNNARIYYSQSLWDAGMANSIFRFSKKNRDKKVFHCVGKFHVDEKLGTAAQLQLLNSKLRIMNISCFSDSSFTEPDWSRFSHLGDFVILTDPSLKKTY